ncbi:MAG: rhomboid family intramembrane serine protease [Dehalococcoidales bacterium]|nr:rhomboid family intramembrane serine protease [Dehalococcoidales bacterium]
MRRNSWSPSSNVIWVLIGANVLIFIASLIGRNSAIFDTLAISRSNLTTHPWSLVTSLFLHDPYNYFHILFNMLWLYWYGSALVQLIGEAKFLILYFAGGIIGNLLFIAIEPNAAAIGASGAVITLGGALAVMRPKIKIVLFPIPIPMDLWIYVIFGTLFLSILIPAMSSGSSIGWQAHLGGLITGVAAGFYFRRWERKRGIWY